MTDGDLAMELERDWALSPGDYIQRALETQGLRQSDLAERTGLSTRYINQLVHAKAPVSGDVAVRLARALGNSAATWTRIAADYELYESTQRDDAKLMEYLPWAQQFDSATLVKHRVTTRRDAAVDLVDKVLRFFAVSSPAAFNDTYMRPRVSFRRSQAYEVEEPNTALWLRLVELQAEHQAVPALNPARLRRSATVLPSYSALPIVDGFTAARRTLQEAGVALVFLATIPGTRVHAATWWFGGDRPVIAITERQKRVDTFWFNLMHEVGHVLLHPRRRTFLDLEEQLKSDSGEEAEANDFAQRTLLGDHGREQLASLTTRDELGRFAVDRGVALTIVAGQWAHLTGNYAAVARLRVKISDEEIAELEQLSEAKSDWWRS